MTRLYHKKHMMLFSISTTLLEYNNLQFLLFLRHFVLWTKYFFVERMNPRYLNCVTWMIWSLTLTSKVKLLRLLLKLHYKYFACFYSNEILTLIKLVSKSPTSHSIPPSTLQLRLYHVQNPYVLVQAIEYVL
jgi:hypothetical protein